MFLFNLRSAISGTQQEVEQSPVDIVVRLADRISTSLLLEDKREACYELRKISKKHRLHVGAHALSALTEVLHSQPDTETSIQILETLVDVTAPEVFEEEEQEGGTSCGAQFTEIFLKKPENVISVINVLEEYDFRIRLAAIRLLMNLLTNKAKEMQEIILTCAMGVAMLIDVLSDSRDFVRNEVLLLLIHLTKNNTEIQKIIGFQGGFNQLFKVIHSEGYSEGGVVVNDCLQLMLNLLERNSKNQEMFREESCMKTMMPFFESCHQSPEERPNAEDSRSLGVWPEMKAKNVHSMLQVLRTLVSPANASQAVTLAQKAAASCRLLEELCNLLMKPGVPAEVLSEIICTVGDIIRGDRSNQEFFGQVAVASPDQPRNALGVLLMAMVNEKQPISLRAAVLYCFQCYLYKNDISQGQIVQALLPTSADAIRSVTPGQLLCGGLFSPDCLSQWLSSVALSHALVGNTNNKELLLRVRLAVSRDSPPVSLLHQTFAALQHQASKVQTRLGILTLLCTWLADCPNAVAEFLKLPNAVAFLTAQVASNEHDEHELLVQSGSAFLLGLCVAFNNDTNSNFTKDSLRQVITKRIGVETFNDKLAEIAKHVIYTRALKHPQNRIEGPTDLALDHEFCRLHKELEGALAKAVAPPSDSPPAEEFKAVAKYKDVIRDQDVKIQHLQQRLAELEADRIASIGKIDELNSTVQTLTDENTLLKAQKNNNVIVNGSGFRNEPDDSLMKEVQNLRLENDRLREEVKRASESTPQDLEVCSFFKASSSPASDAELKKARNRIECLEAEIAGLQKAMAVEKEKADSLSEEAERVKKDQEDLLVLLADQDAQVLKYRDRLRKLGQTVTDDEDEDDLGEDEDDEELL